MEEVAEGIYRLEVKIPKIDTIFVVYLIGETQGAILEPGPAFGAPLIREAVRESGIKQIAYIIPTHIHLDHAGAAGTLAQFFPEAKVVVHPKAAKHAIDPSRLLESTKMAFDDNFEMTFGHTIPIPESQIKVPEDGEIISIDGRELQIIYAPGHAPHNMVVFDKKTQGLFCGETLGTPLAGAESEPIPLAAPPSFDIDIYLSTMEEMGKLNPRVLFYAHDGIGRQPDKLIPRAMENTRIFGDLIQEALNRGETNGAIKRQIRDYIARHFGVNNAESVDIDMSVDGFIFYFKQKKERA